MFDSSDDRVMSLIGHLEELRKRLVICAFALAIGMVICFIFKGYLLDLLVQPLGDRKLITLTPTESFMTVFKVAAYVGMIVVSPVIIYQIWAFVSPGLKGKEKRVIVFASFFTSILFLCGVAFAWLLVLPRALNFLLTYQDDFFNQQVQAARYFSFVALFLLGFGLIFELPALLLTLVRLGIVTPKKLAQNRRYAVLAGSILSAALTPSQDFFSILAMAIPFYVLYEISIHLGKLVQKRSRGKAEVIDGGPEGEAAG
ncbi:MAG: twin-arginine translocase subunit TatC [Thermoleophilia bacterium]